VGYLAFSFLCTLVPGSEKSRERTFAPVELSFRGTFARREWKVRELSHPCKFCSSGANVPRTFVPWPATPLPKPSLRTKKYSSFINFGLHHYQPKNVTPNHCAVQCAHPFHCIYVMYVVCFNFYCFYVLSLAFHLLFGPRAASLLLNWLIDWWNFSSRGTFAPQTTFMPFNIVDAVYVNVSLLPKRCVKL